MRYAVLDAQNVVINIIVAETDWTPPAGTTKREATAGCETDGRWTGSAWEAAPAAPPERILSVLPVAWRRAMRSLPAPAGDGTALDYVIAALSQPGYEDARDALEYMVRAERADMIALGSALGFDEANVDEVLSIAASYPGSDAVRGQA